MIETKISRANMISIGNKLSFFDFFVVEGVRNAGGIDMFGKQGV